MAEDTGEPVALSGWFADPDTTDEVDLGSCRCPGSPHDHDSATFRTQWGDGERKSIFYAGAGMRLRADGTIGSDGTYDPEATNNELLARGIVAWTLRDGNGEPAPITRRMVALLPEEARLKLLTALQEADALFRSGPLPNASGARSRGSSRASASRTRTTTRRR